MPPNSSSQSTEKWNNAKLDRKSIEPIIDKHLIEQKDKYFFGEFEMPLKWPTIIGLIVLHTIAIIELIRFDWTQWKIILYVYCWCTIAGFGVTGGAHRYYTHRSYKAKKPLQIILLLCYSVAGQNTMPEWVRDHRVHHKFSDTDADPHNINRGFFFSHMGWLMMRKKPAVIRKGRALDISDVTSDPLVQWHTKYFVPLKILLCFVLPTLTTRYILESTWWFCISSTITRYVITLNSTWSVNSFAHMFGNKPIDSRIKPVQNAFVSFFAMGEGWHNYHHTFPWDYRTAEMGTKLNFTANFLDLFAKIGWAYDLKYPSDDLINRIADKYGDGSRRSSDHNHCYQDQINKE